MTKETYFKKLKESLSPIPEEEREEAISFYREYFEDAGNDEEAIKTLGAPARLGAQIVAEYAADYLEEKAARKKEEPEEEEKKEDEKKETLAAKENLPAEKPPVSFAELTPAVPVGTAAPGIVSPYTKSGFVSVAKPASSAAAATALAPAEAQANGTVTPSPYAGAKPQSSTKAIWYIILGIFALPVGLPVAIAALAIIITVVAVCFAIIVALIAVIFALGAAGIGSLFFGATSTMMGAGAVLLSIGGALISAGLLLLLLPLFVKLIVWLVNSVGKLVSKIFNKLKKGKDNNEQKND